MRHAPHYSFQGNLKLPSSLSEYRLNLDIKVFKDDLNNQSVLFTVWSGYSSAKMFLTSVSNAA